MGNRNTEPAPVWRGRRPSAATPALGELDQTSHHLECTTKTKVLQKNLSYDKNANVNICCIIWSRLLNNGTHRIGVSCADDVS